MDKELLNTILASGAVSAIVSGIVGFFTAGRVEKIKNDFAINQERTKRLGEAHTELLVIKQLKDFPKNPGEETMEAFVEVVKGLKDEFSKAEKIYQKVRPLLNIKQQKVIDLKLEEHETINQKVIAQLNSSKGKSNPNLEEDLITPMMIYRDSFIGVLKNEISNAYSNLTGN